MSSPPHSYDLRLVEGISATAACQALQALPTHLLEEVLLRLDCSSLASSCAVSRGLRAAASSDALWAAQLHREFGVEVGNLPTRRRQPLPGCQPLQLPQLLQPLTHSGVSSGHFPEPHPGAARSPSGQRAQRRRAPSGAAEAAMTDAAGAATAAPAEAANSSDSPAGTETTWEESLAPKQRDGAVVPEPRPSGPEAGESAGAMFRRLARNPLAQHLLYVRRFHALVAAVTSWTVRIRLIDPGTKAQGQGQGSACGSGAGGADEAVVLRSFLCRCRGVARNPQSVWLRFRLPGWVRRPRHAGTGHQDQPPWEPGDTCGGSGGGWDGKPYMELTVLAKSPLPIRPLGPLQPGFIRWPVMHSTPFRLPHGDRMRLLQSHVEGLYVWDDDGDGAEAEAEAEEDDDDDDDGDYAHEGEDGKEAEDCRENEAAGSGKGDTASQTRPRPPRPPRVPRGPHLAAYLHYEQLLPVTPPELEPEASLTAHMPLHGPPPSHPGSVHHAARLIANQPRKHPRRPSPPPQQQQQQQQQQPLRPHLPGLAAAFSKPENSAPQDASNLPRMICSDTAPPGPTPRPVMFLYLDWSLLPTVTTHSTATVTASSSSSAAAAAAAATAEASSTGGWVAGCVVRLWLDAPPVPHMLATPVNHQVHQVHQGDAAPELGLGLVGRSAQCVTGDSRRADIVLLKPLSLLPADSSAPTSIAMPRPSASRYETLTAAGKSGEEEQKKRPAAAAVELAAAWMRAFGPGPSFTCDPDEFATGADLQLCAHPIQRTGTVLAAARGSAADDTRSGRRQYGGGYPRGCSAAGSGQAEAAHPSATDPGVSEAQVPSAGSAARSESTAEANQVAESSALEGTGADVGVAAAAAVIPSPLPSASRSPLRVLRGAEAAICLRELCEGPLPMMVDLALLDPEGTIRLGRCGVEMWNGQDGDNEGAAGGTGGSVSMHFLLDQLPPRLQSLWDNKLELRWGQAAAAAAGEEARARGNDGDGRSNASDGMSAADQVAAGAGNGGIGGGGGGGGVQQMGPGPVQPWVRVVLQMPLRNYEVLMAQSES